MKFQKNIIKISCILVFIIVGGVNAQQNLAQEAYAIFEQSCLICHGENGSFRESLIIEHTALIDDGKVIPGDPAGSVFYQRLIETNIAKRMPQGQPPLAPEAIETIRQWILAGAPDWNAIPRPNTSFITTDTIFETIENHVNSLSPRDKSFARYFTLTHLYNAGETTEALNAYRRALSKLINSLSWGREVVNPKPIDTEQTIFYIDLRDYEWDVRNDAWTQIEQAYPYKMAFDAPTQTQLREKLTTLQQEMSCEVPFVHVDWFLATASLPPLYHDILALPETDRELEAALEVYVAENILNAPGKRVWRAGFNDSGVSQHNRVVERHISRYGAYWKSYDFAGSADEQNIFTHPLDFTQDGGEIIFNLPNGLQAYLIVDREGIRIDAAPISIVRNLAASDPTVRNGLSCIGCHTKGMQTFEDKVRATVEKATNPPYDKVKALDLYVQKTVMDSLVAEDTQRFRVALEKTGGVFGGIEPVQRFHGAFQGPLSAAHAAAAVGLQTQDFVQKILRNERLQSLGLLVLTDENGNIKRDAWTSNFHDMISALNTPDSVLPPVVERPERIPGAGVYIPDANLRTAIEEALDKAVDDVITTEEMATLTTLRASNRYIQDLTGIQHAINLENLWISGNPVSNISPLAGLKNLIGLAAWDMDIEDFSPLAELTNLQWLELFNTLILDISPLARLTNLKKLRLYGTGTENLAPLAGLTSLTLLQIANNETLSNVAPLAGLINLEWLDLHRCDSLSDISSLAGLTKLEYLNLNHSRRVHDYSLSPLSGLTGLRRLRLAENRISDVSSLAGPGLTSLERLDLPRNEIVDLSPLSGLTGLRELYLHANRISDVSSLAGLINLEWLDLRVNQIVDISVLDGLAARTYITWVENPGAPIGGTKIEGPWLWVPIPEKQLDNKTDLLSEVSGGAVTEHQIATRGATEGKAVGNYEWTAHKISPTGTYGGTTNNMLEMVRAFGLPEEYEWSTEVIVVYGSVILDSPREQKINMFMGSAGRNKVWLNGELIYEQLIRPAEYDYWRDDDDGFNQYFPVTLKQGPNVLLVALGNGGTITGHFGFEEGTEYTVLNASDINIPDPNLRAAIAEVLGKGDTAPITLAEMATLERLELNEKDISDLTGLEFAINMSWLAINDNNISDLTPLAGLITLSELRFNRNPVSDLSPLKNLINLTGLWFEGTQFADLTPLTGLINLETLIFVSPNVSDLSPIEGLKNLTVLWPRGRHISDLSPIAGLTNLKDFLMWGSPVSDLSPFAELTQIERIDICGANISDLTPLAGLTNLKTLALADNKVSDLSPIAGLTELERVELRDNNIIDVSPLAGFTKLIRLGLNNNNITDFSPLDGIRENLKKYVWHGNPGFPEGGTKIEGPWLWINFPELFNQGDREKDFLSEVSGGTVTEEDIAIHGAIEGQSVGSSVWTSHKLLTTGTIAAPDLNTPSQHEDYGFLYGSVSIYSPQEQETTMYVGTAGGTKVWLNGTLTFSGGDYGGVVDSYTDFFPVTLQQGRNVLLIRILSLGKLFIGFESGTEYTVLPTSSIYIPDPNLRAAIAEALGKKDSPIVTITLEEMATLTQLEAMNKGIQDLTGLEFATDLHELYLSDNLISDLSPLKNLKNLAWLKLHNNPISDLSPLSEMTQLRELTLADHSDFDLGVVDLSPLAGLNNLTRFGFNNIKAVDLKPLAGLVNLEELRLSSNGVSDFSPLKDLVNLKSIHTWGNPVSDISFLTKLTNLQELNICGGENISDLSPLSELKALKTLYLFDSGISDVSALAGLTGLTGLELRNNNISDVSPLAGLTNLKWLNLRGNVISDFSALDELAKSTAISRAFNPGAPIAGPKIEGPWLWVTVPRDNLDDPVDFLSEASDGAVTEQRIATNGAIEGNSVGNSVWVSSKISPEEDSANIGHMLRSLNIETHRHKGVVYGSVILGSAREQDITMLAGSAGPLKVWLNGEVVYEASAWHRGKDYQDFFPVTLKQGANILLVSVQMRTHSEADGYFGFEEGAEYTVVPPDMVSRLTFSATETTNLLAGDTFTLNLNAENITDLAGWQADIAYDPNVLEAVEVTEGDFLKTDDAATFFQGGTIDNTTGKITGIFAARQSESGTSGTGTLLSVAFKAKAGGETEVVMENFEFGAITGDIIPAVPPNITITVGDYPPWDVNRDGRVSILDIVLVARDLGSGASANLRTDVNRDGVVNIQDLVLVSNHMGETTDSAAPPGLAIDDKELMAITVQTWIKQAQTEDDGSLAFRQGIENLERLLASLIPEKTALLPNYPNPFNPETWIPYQLSTPADVSLTIYDMQGIVVRELKLGHQAAGTYQSRSRAAYWDGRNAVGESVASGVYFYTLTAGDFSATRKMLILK